MIKVPKANIGGVVWWRKTLLPPKLGHVQLTVRVISTTPRQSHPNDYAMFQVGRKEGRKCFIYRRIRHILFTVMWRRTYGKGPFR